MDRKQVAQELVDISKLMLGADAPEFVADKEAVDKLAEKLLARLGQQKARKLRQYGVEAKPTDSVETLAKVWATVILGV